MSRAAQIGDALVIDADSSTYMPVVFVNEAWVSHGGMAPINETTPQLPLAVSFSVVSLMRWQLAVQLQEQLRLSVLLLAPWT